MRPTAQLRYLLLSAAAASAGAALIHLKALEIQTCVAMPCSVGAARGWRQQGALTTQGQVTQRDRVKPEAQYSVQSGCGAS